MPFTVGTSARQATPALPSEQPLPPAPGFIDTLAASARVGVDETRDAQDGRLRESYEELAGTLGDLGVQRSALLRDQPWYQLPAPGGSLDRDKVWAAVSAARQRDANAFKGIPDTREDYDQWILRRRGARDADQLAVARGSGVAGFIGQSAVDIADNDLGPLQFMAGIGAESILVSMLKNGVVNAGLEAVKTPERVTTRQQLGETMGVGEQLANVGGAFVGGALLTGAGEVIGRQIAPWASDAVQGAFERSVAANWERLPQGLRDRWTARATIDGTPASDALVADLTEAIVGTGRMSETETGAVSILRRQAYAADRNPFAPDGAGLSAHAALQDEALARIIADTPVRSLTPPSSPAGMTAISTGTVPGDALDAFMARARRAESSGNDAAQAPTSSAFGRYQFTRGTWLRFYERRFGTGGLSREQILAKRADGRLQDVLMRDLTEYNAGILRENGVPVTPGNLYVVHFAGEGDAARLFSAEAGLPASSVMHAESVNANPFLRKMTVGEVLAWADRKMGGQGTVARGSGLRPGEVSADGADGIRAEIDALNAENARIEAELRGEPRPAIDVPDHVADVGTMVDLPDLPPVRAADIDVEPRAFDPDAPSSEVLALLPQLRDVIDDRGRSLNQIERLADELGATPEEVRRGLTVLTREGRIAMRRDTGGFMRRPPPLDGPQDVLEFVAQRGGIRDDEGHALGLIREEGRFAGQKGGRDWRKMTRRNGPLLRRNGKSIDEVGEALWEAGYLRGRDSERPTTAEVLSYLDQRILDGKPRFTMADVAHAPDPARPYWDVPGEPQVDPMLGLTPREIEELSFAATWLGKPLDGIDPAILSRARDFVLDGSALEDPGEALTRALDEFLDANRWDAVEQTGDVRYEDVDYGRSNDLQPGGKDRAAEGDRGGPEGSAADARARATRGGADGSAGEAAAPLAALPHEERTRFLDPDGPDAQAQAMTLEHDARMATVRDRNAERRKIIESYESEYRRSYRLRQRDFVDDRFATLAADDSMARLGGDNPANDDAVADLALERQDAKYAAQQTALADQFGKEFTRRNPYRFELSQEVVDRLKAFDAETARLENGDIPTSDPNVIARQQQEAQLAAEAPLRGENRTGQAQDGTMGLGLFDAADQPEFRLDVEGGETSLRDLLDEIDAETRDIDTIESCMKPQAPETEA